MDAFVASTLPRDGDYPRKLTEDELASIQDILDAAYAWSQGEMPLTAVWRLGIVEYEGVPSPRYTRWLATGTGSRTDPRWQALQKALDVVIRKHHIVTTQGVFQPVEMTEHHQSVEFVRANPSHRDAA